MTLVFGSHQLYAQSDTKLKFRKQIEWIHCHLSFRLLLNFLFGNIENMGMEPMEAF